jgi:hypothetical protein
LPSRFFASIAYRADLQAQGVDLSVAITTKVGFVFHAHKASELPLFVVRCLTDVNTLVMNAFNRLTIKRIVMVLKVLFDGSFNALIKSTPKTPGTN